MLEIGEVLPHSVSLPSVLSSTTFDGLEETNDFEWRIVGKDVWTGQLFIFWHKVKDLEPCEERDVEGDPKPPDLGVKISVFDVRTHEAKVIFSSDDYYDIIQCSTDLERTRIAFVCKTTQKCHIQTSDFGQDPQDTLTSEENRFTCYWAILNSDAEHSRVFLLKSETMAEITVHYLSATQLLVFMLSEGIYRYTLPTTGNTRKNSLASVEFEKIAGPFPWAQWDIASGRVFYLHFRNLNRAHTAWNGEYYNAKESSASSQLCPFLVGLQFHPHSAFETLLNMPLETLVIQGFDDTPSDNANNQNKRHSPLANIISDSTLALQLHVFVQDNGTVSICQGIIQERQSRRQVGLHTTEAPSLEVSYSVTLLHHGCTLHCQVEVRKQRYNNNMKLIFAPCEDGILVISPGLFTHLLDVGLDHEPSNHILYPDCLVPMPDIDECMECLYSERGTGCTLQLLVTGNAKLKVFDINITPSSLLLALKQLSCGPFDMSSIRLAMLHHLLLHRPDFSAMEEALQHLAKDVTNPQITKFFQEFLLCGSYARTRDHLEDNFVSLLPLSVSKPLDAVEDISHNGQMLTTVTYTLLVKDVSSILLSPNERHIPRSNVTDPWSQLWNHMRLRSSSSSVNSSISRFSAESLRNRLRTMGSPSASPNVLPYTSSSSSLSKMTSDAAAATVMPSSSMSNQPMISTTSSICRRILGVAAELGRVLGSTQLTNADLNPKFPFSSFGEDEDDSCTLLEQIVSLNLREVTVHFLKCLPGEVSLKIDNAACTYVANRLHQSQLLCHFLFQALDVRPNLQGEHHDSHPYAFLDAVPMATCRKLFSVLERYMVAVEDIVFPRPQGFDNFFSVLAYRCLEFSIFLRYVDYGVVQLTNDVLNCISASSTMQSSENRSVGNYHIDDMVMEIISRLPRHRSLQLLKQWDQPSTRLVRIHDIVEQYLHSQYVAEESDEDEEVEPSAISSKEAKEESDRVKEAKRHEDVMDLSAFPASVTMALKCFLLHLENEKRPEHAKSSATSFSHLSDNLELVRSVQLSNIVESSQRT